MGFKINPASTASQTNYTILKARDIVSGLSAVKPEVYTKLVRSYGLDNISGWMESKSQMEGISNLQYFHGEKESIREVATVGTGTAQPAADAPQTVNLGATSLATQITPQSPFVGAAGTIVTIPVAVQDIVEYPNRQQGIVTSVGASNFVVHPIIAGAAGRLPATVTGDKIKIKNTAVKEASGSVASRFTEITGYQNQVQRFRRTVDVTGDSLATKDWFDNLGEGQNSEYYFSEQIMDGYINHENDKEIGLISNKMNTSATLAAANGGINATTLTTEGYIPWVESAGHVHNYGAAGTLDLGDFDTAVSLFAKFRGAMEYEVWTGVNPAKQTDDFLRGEAGLSAGGVTYSTAVKDRYVDFGFKSFNRSGVTFHMKRLGVLDLPEYLGGVGSSYAEMLMCIPMSNVATPAYSGQGGVTVPAMRIVYQDAQDYTNGHREWFHGGRAPVPTNGEDKVVYEFQSVCGFEGFAGNRHLLMTAT